MTALQIVPGVIVGLALLIVVWVIAIYNRLVALRQTTNQSWSDVDVQLR